MIAEKFLLRKEIRERLSKQTDTQRLQKSKIIKDELFKLAEFRRAKLVMFYVSTREEVQTKKMIVEAQKIGKKIAVPAILVGKKRMIASITEDLENELAVGSYGILQPKKGYIREVPHSLIDIVIVPGLAFDRQGHRLGRGRGYYDKFLANLTSGIPRVGLAFDFQVLKNLPVASHDISVDKVIFA